MTRKQIKERAARFAKIADSKKFSGKFVLRLEPAMHHRLALKALATGESLNSYCVKALAKA